MFFVAVLNLLSNHSATYPPGLRLVIQSCSGIVIGSRFKYSDLRDLRQMVLPIIILVIMMLFFNVAFAMVISQVTNLTAITALLACAPGGVSDIALVASDFGANTEQVALLQIFRFVTVILFFPLFVKKFFCKDTGENHKTDRTDTASDEKQILLKNTGIKKLALFIPAAALASLLFRMLNIPAGALIGSMLITLILNMTVGDVYIPKIFKTVLQLLAGCYIGSRITMDAILSLKSLVLPMLLIIVELLLMVFVTSWMIGRITKIDKKTCLFSCIPGGMSEMGMIAEEMRLDLPKIMLMHSCRLVAVICLIPVFAGLFFKA